MGTRSRIAAQMADGSFASIYCHWDGYPSHNGAVLLAHYATPDKVARLIRLGDLSVLAASPAKPKGHTFTAPVGGHCVAYGRDRGEKDCRALTGPTLASVTPDGGWEEYIYVWRNGAWSYAPIGKRLRPLTPAACAKA